MSDCRECEIFPCFLVKMNNDKHLTNCLGPVFLDINKPEEGRKEILKKIRSMIPND